MQKKVLGILLALTVLLCMLPFAFSASAATAVSACAHTAFADGKCSDCEAIVIGNADELIALMNQDGYSWSASYVLTDNIDLTGKTGQAPIGNATTAYGGTFDGNGKTISGVNISGDVSVSGTQGFLGFFGKVLTNTVIEDLTISGSVSGTGTVKSVYVGGLVGYSANNITIRNCTNSCTVTGISTSAETSASIRVGGIIGIANTSGTAAITIENCHNTATVDTSSSTITAASAGGIIGAFNYSTSASTTVSIEQCSNTGTVKGKENVGGIGGYLYFAKAPTNSSQVLISECWNDGSVSGDQYVGGIAGLHQYMNISDCWNTGAVTAADGSEGGISGRLHNKSKSKEIAYSYNANGTHAVAGVATGTGYTNANVVGSYYKAGTGITDPKGAVAYDHESHFATLNTNDKWTGTTNPMLKHFHPTHTFVNGTCECGVSDDCAHDVSLTASVNANGGIDYICASCEATAVTIPAEDLQKDIYVKTTGMDFSKPTTLGSASNPFTDFETAMLYASAAAAAQDSTATVHIVDDAYVPASYASPEYAGAITITGDRDRDAGTAGTLHFDASTRRYFANGDITFENLTFKSTSNAGMRIFGQNHKLVMGEGLVMGNESSTALEEFPAVNGIKMYVHAGFDGADTPETMNTNLTVRSGNYHYIGGWNYSGTAYATEGTGTVTLGKTNDADELFINIFNAFSVNEQQLTKESKVTVNIDNEVDIRWFYYGLQNDITEENKKDMLYEVDLILGANAELNTLADETVGLMDVRGALTNRNTRLNIFVDETSETARKSAAVFTNAYTYDGIAVDESVLNMKTVVTCASLSSACGIAKKHSVGNAVWTKNGDAYELVCGGCEKVITVAKQPFVYVDANTHLDEDLGEDTADGLSLFNAVLTIEEAVRRLATTGGKVILTDRYVIDKTITLPAYSKEITFTADRSTGFSYSGTTGCTLNLGGPTKFEHIVFNNGSKIWIFAAHWNDLTFGEGVVAYGSSYVIMGQNDLPNDGNGNGVNHNVPAHATLTLNPVTQKTEGKVFYQQVYLGDRGNRGSNILNYTVSNKTVVANFNDVEITTLYAGTISSTDENAQMVNCNVTINMTGDANVHTMKNGYQNTSGDCDAYLHSLTLNLDDNAIVSSDLSGNNVRHLKVYVSGEADGRTTPLPISIYFSKSTGYEPFGDESADLTYSSHSFENGKTLFYNDMFKNHGTDIKRIKSDCDFATATGEYTTDGQLYACECGRTEAVATEGIYVWTDNLVTDEDGTVTVDLYAKSNIDFWGVNFSVAAEGYTLDTEKISGENIETVDGVFSFANGSASMAVLSLDPDNLSGTLATTKIATLTFTKGEGTETDANVVVTIISAYDAEGTDLTAQAYAATASKTAYYVDDTTTTYGGGVVLDNEYILEYTVNASENITVDNAYMVFESTDANGYVATFKAYPYQVGTKIRFQAPGIAAKNMGDEITGTLYYTVDGVTYKAQTTSFNLGDYYTKAIKAYADDAYADLRTLLNTMFNYGAAAQTYFGYDAENLSNSIVAEDDRVDYATAEVVADAKTSVETLAGATYKAAAANVVLEQRVLFGLKFELVDEAAAHIDLTNLTFQGSYTDVKGQSKEILITGDKMTINAANQLCFDIDQVAAKDLNQMITGALYNGEEQVSDMISFNLECYVTKALEKADSTDALKAVCKAVLDYSRAAAAWLQ